MKRNLLFLIALAAVLACAPSVPLVQQADTLGQPPSCTGSDGVCDIYLRPGAFVRTLYKTQLSGDTMHIVCTDEIGVTLVSGIHTPRGATLLRNWPPVSRKMALNAIAGAYAITQWCHLTESTKDSTSNSADTLVIATPQEAPAKAPLALDSKTSLRFFPRGAILFDYQGDTLAALRVVNQDVAR